jgi:cytochrome c biogenesis protein CcdA
MTHVHTAILLIRFSIGLLMLCFGLSQMNNPKRWEVFLPSWLIKILALFGLSPKIAIRIHALGNLTLGTLLAIGLWPSVIPLLVIVWLATVGTFASRVDWTIGLRDYALMATVIGLFLLER